MRAMLGVTVLACALAAGTAAAATPAQKCESGKNKVAGAYFACRAKAEAAAITKGTSPDFSKCTAKFDEKWALAESKAAGDCPDDVLTPEMNAYLAAEASAAAVIIAGSEGIPACGDDIVNVAGELCDGTDLVGNTCATLGQSLGTLACTDGCQLDASDCSECPGFEYAGACWVMGSIGGDCQTACTALGLDYDPATATIAGSGGTDEACDDVLDGIGGFGTAVEPVPEPCPTGLGCIFTFLSDRFRCATPATDAVAAMGGVARACACQ